MPLLRRLSRLACATLAATATALAANLPPEATTPLPPTLTLARGATSTPLALSAHFRDPDVPGSAVRITTRIGTTTRVMDLALFDAQAPLTVDNFLDYVDAGHFAANFFHRSVPGFIIQTGGFFFVNDNTFDVVPTFAPVLNEPGASNLRGTIAMAKLGGDPNSATSGWFINLADNSANLDTQNGGFTVFGRVLGDGMQVADAIATLTRYNATAYASAWTDLPLTTGVLARGNFVETSAARISPLSFAVTSDHPTLVAAILADGALSLTANAELGGQTTIRITATDLEGATFASSLTVIVPRPQAIVFPTIADFAFEFFPLGLHATAGSELPVIYELVSGPVTLSSSWFTPNGVGEVTIRATQTGNAFFSAAAPVERTFTILKRPQTITLPATPALATGDSYNPRATADSELPVAYEIVSGPATVLTLQDGSGNILGTRIRITGPGEITFRVTQAGDTFHETATPVERTFTAAPPFAQAQIRLPAATYVYDALAHEAQAVTTPEGLNVAYTYKFGTAPATTEPPVHAGRYTVTATIDDLRTLSRASVTSTLTINKYPLGIRALPASRPVGQLNPAFEFEFLDFPQGKVVPIPNPPTPVTKATLKSPQGDYPITFTGGSHPDLTFVTAPSPGVLTVVGFGGTYDALLGDESAPLGKLTLTIPANSLSYTGTLTLASETKPIAIKSTSPLAFPDVNEAATGTWTRPIASGVPPLTLTFSFHTEQSPFPGEKSGRFQCPGFDHSFQLELRGRPASVPLAGQHTLVLSPPLPPLDSAPQGHGHATVRITPTTAVLSLTGALADGTKLTATIQPNLDGTTYLLWTNPYGSRLHSYLAGHLNNEHVSTLIWKKAGSEKDKSHRAGIVPLPLDALITPWLPPTKGKAETATNAAIPAITLADRLGLAADDATATAAFGLDYLPPPGAAFTEAQIDGLPAALGLTLAVNGKPVLPSPNPAKFALTLNPTTGAFSGSFVLTDLVPAPTPKNSEATKLHPRKVSFSGVLRQPPSGETAAPVGQGFFLLPALPGTASTEQVSGEIRLLPPAP